APGPGPPGRRRLPHGGAHVLLHRAVGGRARRRGGGWSGRARGARARPPRAQGGSPGGLLRRGPVRARRGADLPEDRRGGGGGRRRGPRRRGRRAGGVRARRSLVPRHGAARQSRDSAATAVRGAGAAAPRTARSRMRGRGPTSAPLVLATVLAACSASGIEGGVYRSSKGYAVKLPEQGWRVQPSREADLELRRDEPPGGMPAGATPGGRHGGPPP